MARKLGKIEVFDHLKGFGYIAPHDGGTPLYIHYSALLGSGESYQSLQIGDAVLYDEVDFGEGAQARNVQIVEANQVEQFVLTEDMAEQNSSADIPSK